MPGQGPPIASFAAHTNPYKTVVHSSSKDYFDLYVKTQLPTAPSGAIESYRFHLQCDLEWVSRQRDNAQNKGAAVEKIIRLEDRIDELVDMIFMLVDAVEDRRIRADAA